MSPDRDLPVVRSLKARLDSERTTSERLADRMSKAFGSTWFLAFNVVWFVVWIVLNVNVIPDVHPFDPYPFGFLTLAVSLEAIVLAIFVLIAQNRSEHIAELRAETDLQVNLITERELTKLLRMVVLLLAKAGIKEENDAELEEMVAPTNIEKIEQILAEQLAGKVS